MKLKTLALFATLSVTACASNRPIVTTPPAACAKLIPQSWREGVEAAPIPDDTTDPLEAARRWASAYVGMSGQLEKANDRTGAVIEIVAGCETMVNAAR